MRSILRVAGPALLSSALCIALAAPSAGAAVRPSLASVASHVHSADGALVKLERVVTSNRKAALKALSSNRSQITMAARTATALRYTAAAGTAAKALSLVVGQYDRDVKVYTSAVGSTSGALQTLLAQALQPAIAGRAEALGFLGQLTGLLGSSGASSAGGTIAGQLQNVPGEIQSLGGLLSGGQLPPQIQALIGQALSTAGGLLDAGLAMLKTVIPTLPAPAQSLVGGIVDQLTALFGQIKATFTQVGQTVTGTLGGPVATTITGELSQVLSLLQGFLGGIGGSQGGSTASTGLTGLTGLLGGGSTGSTGSTGTGSGPLGGFGIPSFIQNLLGGFGLGGLPFGLSADHG